MLRLSEFELYERELSSLKISARMLKIILEPNGHTNEQISIHFSIPWAPADIKCIVIMFTSSDAWKSLKIHKSKCFLWAIIWVVSS